MPKKNPVIASNDKGLDDRQEKFCHEYLKDFNATRAARDSGYAEKTARIQASDLLSRPNIQARIKEISQTAFEKLGGDPVERIIVELQLIAFGDIKDLMEWDKWSIKWKESKDLGDKTRMIQEISESTTSSGGSRKLKMYDKLKAMEMLMRYYGIFKDPKDDDENDVPKQRVVINMIPNGREKKIVEAEFKELKQ